MARLTTIAPLCPARPADSVLGEYAAEAIEQNDQKAFVELALKEIERLHEGTIARYRIRPSEYHTWKDARL